MNILLALILLKGWKQFRKNVFYRIVWQLIFADLFAQIVQLFVAVPTTFVGQKIFSDSWLSFIIFMQFDSISFYASMYFSALMTLNRFAVFFCESLNEKLFSNRPMKIILFVIWIFIFVFITVYSISGCLKTFSPTGFFMYNLCSSPNFLMNFFRMWGYYASTYLPAAMLLAYFAIYIRVRYFVNTNLFQMSSIEKERKKREKSVLLQAFLICGFLELQDLAFIYIPKIPVEGQWSYLLTFTINWSGILLNSMSPIILFNFNKEIAEGLKKLIGDNILQRFSSVTHVHSIQQTSMQSAQH
uniref:G-protein coupled receptors family 1 profile domain-containing protein n=1 Tax=Meloidogyne incognita TaxID=6306 RepID=A0A914KM09_MELIC